jgi:hypothetical protein
MADGSGDVRDLVLEVQADGASSVEVTIENHDSKPNDYAVMVRIESPDGTTKHGNAVIARNRVAPLATVAARAGTSLATAPPIDAVDRVIEVYRIPSQAF